MGQLTHTHTDCLMLISARGLAKSLAKCLGVENRKMAPPACEWRGGATSRRTRIAQTRAVGAHWPLGRASNAAPLLTALLSDGSIAAPDTRCRRRQRWRAKALRTLRMRIGHFISTRPADSISFHSGFEGKFSSNGDDDRSLDQECAPPSS